MTDEERLEANSAKFAQLLQAKESDTAQISTTET